MTTNQQGKLINIIIPDTPKNKESTTPSAMEGYNTQFSRKLDIMELCLAELVCSIKHVLYKLLVQYQSPNGMLWPPTQTCQSNHYLSPFGGPFTVLSKFDPYISIPFKTKHNK